MKKQRTPTTRVLIQKEVKNGDVSSSKGKIKIKKKRKEGVKESAD